MHLPLPTHQQHLTLSLGEGGAQNLVQGPTKVFPSGTLSTEVVLSLGLHYIRPGNLQTWKVDANDSKTNKHSNKDCLVIRLLEMILLFYHFPNHPNHLLVLRCLKINTQGGIALHKGWAGKM